MDSRQDGLLVSEACPVDSVCRVVWYNSSNQWIIAAIESSLFLGIVRSYVDIVTVGKTGFNLICSPLCVDYRSWGTSSHPRICHIIRSHCTICDPPLLVYRAWDQVVNHQRFLHTDFIGNSLIRYCRLLNDARFWLDEKSNWVNLLK